MLKKYYEYKNMASIQSAYRVEYKEKIAPNHKVIRNIVSVFEKNNSVTHMPPKWKNLSQIREDAKKQLETMVTDFSTISIRKAASAVGVSPTLVYHILHDDLHLKPHKYQEWHKLDAHDYEKRVEFAHWFLSRPKEAKYFFICSDEAYFYLTLPINKQNNRMWSDSRPLEGI